MTTRPPTAAGVYPLVDLGFDLRTAGPNYQTWNRAGVLTSGKRFPPPCVSWPPKFRNKLCYEANVETTRQNKQKSDFGDVLNIQNPERHEHANYNYHFVDKDILWQREGIPFQ